MSSPFIKCVGGKTQWLDILQSAMPEGDVRGTYFEPFVGGGALLWHLWGIGKINNAMIGDANRHLINCYRWMQSAPALLWEHVCVLMDHHSETLYYEVRDKLNERLFSDESLEASAEYIYLNRTCFNGLMRFNKKGGMNSPIGRDAKKNLHTSLPDTLVYQQCAQALKNTAVRQLPFTDMLDFPHKGDFVFCDPPYHETFTEYTRGGFSEEDQESLRDMFAELPCSAMLSNSDTPFIRDLYKDFWIDTFENLRSVGAKTRKVVKDVLVRNY